MGSPVSPIVANLYMEYFEQKAPSTASHPTPRLWHHYVDDTFVIQKEENKRNFLQHVISVDLAIQFTVENNKEDGVIPFLDTIVKPENDGKLPLLYTVSLVPSPIGPKQSVAILSSYKKKWNISGQLLPIVNTPSGLWTRWRKDLPGQLGRSVMGLTAMVLQASSPLPMMLKPRVT